jgi:hypothetical protein
MNWAGCAEVTVALAKFVASKPFGWDTAVALTAVD